MTESIFLICFHFGKGVFNFRMIKERIIAQTILTGRFFDYTAMNTALGINLRFLIEIEYNTNKISLALFNFISI